MSPISTTAQQAGSLPFTQSPADPSLKDVLDILRKSIFLDLSCHHIGTVQSFDESDQTATVIINYTKTYYQLDAATKLYVPIQVSYPTLIDCPVIVLGGGGPAGGALTFPIAQGDECLVLFNDRDMDNWFQGGVNSPVATPRLHSFSDAIVLVGLRSTGNVLGNYDMTRAVLRNGAAQVGVSSSLIKIANDSFTLNGLLQNLITAIQNLVTATAAITVTGVTPGVGISGVPVNAATITAIAATLTTTATDIGELLE